jgi:amino-acid N-acetyltransferase
MNITYRMADKAELPVIADLLTKNKLPASDITDIPVNFFIATDDNNRVIGSIAVEQFETDGLLRSFAVDESYRNQKVGNSLFDRLIDYSLQSGITNLHLLTTTAKKYFSERGFAVLQREEAPASIQATTEFSFLCPSSSTYMKRVLTDSTK